MQITELLVLVAAVILQSVLAGNQGQNRRFQSRYGYGQVPSNTASTSYPVMYMVDGSVIPIYKSVQYPHGFFVYGWPNQYGTPILFHYQFQFNIPVPLNYVPPYIDRPYYLQPLTPNFGSLNNFRNPPNQGSRKTSNVKDQVQQVANFNRGQSQQPSIIEDSAVEIQVSGNDDILQVDEQVSGRMIDISAENSNVLNAGDPESPPSPFPQKTEISRIQVSEQPKEFVTKSDIQEFVENIDQVSDELIEIKPSVTLKVQSHKDLRKLKKSNNSSDSLNDEGKKKSDTAVSRKDKEKERKEKLRKAKQEELRILAEQRKQARLEEIKAEAEKLRLNALKISQASALINDGVEFQDEAESKSETIDENTDETSKVPSLVSETEETYNSDIIEHELEDAEIKVAAEPEETLIDPPAINESENSSDILEFEVKYDDEDVKDESEYVDVRKEMWLPRIETLYGKYGIAMPDKPLAIFLQLQILTEIEKATHSGRKELLGKLKEGIDEEGAIYKYCQFLVAAISFKPYVHRIGEELQVANDKLVDLNHKIQARQPAILTKINNAKLEHGKQSKKKVGKDFIFIPQFDAWLDQKLIKDHVRGAVNIIARAMKDSQFYSGIFNYVKEKHDVLMELFDKIPYSDEIAETLKEAILRTNVIHRINSILGALVLHKIID